MKLLAESSTTSGTRRTHSLVSLGIARKPSQYLRGGDIVMTRILIKMPFLTLTTFYVRNLKLYPRCALARNILS
jgi:hypothetical protein